MSLPKTARAAVVVEYGKPIEIRELPVPREDELEPGALLVRVDVASICGSDVHQWDGMTQALAPAQLPIVLGHEMMGTVVAFGPGPREDSIGQPLKEGDRLLWTHVYCGQCQECRVQHTPTLCRRKKQYMRTNCERFPYLVGGFAQYCYVFPPSGRVRIPDGVPDGVASAASCALRTVIHAFDRVGRVEPHQRADTPQIPRGPGSGGYSPRISRSRRLRAVIRSFIFSDKAEVRVFFFGGVARDATFVVVT